MQDASNDAAQERTRPAFEGAELAFAAAEHSGGPVVVELARFDLTSDPSALEGIAADPGYVAAIVGPDVGGGVSRRLTEAGLAVVSLSPYGRPSTDPTGAWRRLVPTVGVQGAVLARYLERAPGSGAGVCLLADGATATGLLRHVRAAFRGDVLLTATLPPEEIAEPVRRAGCQLVLWDGDGASAAAAIARLPRSVRLLGGERLRDPHLMADAGRRAEGTVSACGCVDLSTSTALAAQRFIQDYQSEHGLPPGPCAVEAWDAAWLLLEALQGSDATREAIAGQVRATVRLDGLLGYAFASTGELARPETGVHLAEVRGGRWIPLA